MKSIPSIHQTLGIILLALCCLCGTSAGKSVSQLNADALRAMKIGRWEKAHEIIVEATDAFGPQALQLFGPRFGWFWYHRGYCEIKLELFDDAMKSFEICYRKFKNGPPVVNQGPRRNFYEKKALLMWGHAAKGAKDWATSIRLYKKFLAERDPKRDRYNKEVLHLNMAINHYKLMMIDEGTKSFEKAVEGVAPGRGIMTAFCAMAKAVIDRDVEDTLLKFTEKNRARLKLEPFEAHRFALNLLELAREANAAGMFRAEFILYSFIPSTLAAIDDIKARLSTLASYDQTVRDGSMSINRARLTEDLAELEDSLSSGAVNEIYVYLFIANRHEKAGNIRGAFAVYQHLELYFPDAQVQTIGTISGHRESNLYNLVRTSSLLKDPLTTERYGSRFLKDFPESGHVKEVRRMILSDLFYQGEYKKCLEVAEAMLPDLVKPSKQHDLCLFVLGGSHYFLGRSVTAQPLLNNYLATYQAKTGSPRHIQAVLYFQAANSARRMEWTKSSLLLKQFLKKYPDSKKNPYFPDALYNLANCHYTKGQFPDALAKVTQVETDFPKITYKEETLTLKGKILQGSGQFKKAEESYLKALTLAEQKRNDFVAAECLFHLVAMIGRETIDGKPNPRITDAIPYYHKFWKNYRIGSLFKAKIAVDGIPAMRKAGKIDEALERLQTVIGGNAQTPDLPGLEEAMDTYANEYLKEHTLEELKDHYFAFPGDHSRDKVTPALFRISIVQCYANLLGSSDPARDEDEVLHAEAIVQTLFKSLQADFALKELPGFILVRIGDFIRLNDAKPEGARIYYEEFLKRPTNQTHKFRALLGLAKLNARGGDAQKLEAIQLLKMIIDDSSDKIEKEQALYLTATIHADQGNHAATITTAKLYLSDKTYRRYSTECRMILGAAHDKAGHLDEALAAYTQIWSGSNPRTAFLTPAMHRWAELLWKRNREGDRQLAYERGHDYIKLTALAMKKGSPEEQAQWKKLSDLFKAYEASSDTTKVEE